MSDGGNLPMEPVLKVTPDRYLPHRYAGASGDFNPIHIDPEFARSVGLPGSILHGLYVMAQVARAATEASGAGPLDLKHLSVQFRGMSVPEAEIVVSAGSGEPDADGNVPVRLEAAQGENRVIRNGEATVRASASG